MDVNALLSNIMGSSRSLSGDVSKKLGDKGSTLLGGAAIGGLAGLLMSNKKARKIATKTLTYGGIIAAGGLAYKVWSEHRSNAQMEQTASPDQAPTQERLPTPPTGSIFDLADQTSAPTNELKLALLRAMISAAKSDGHIDADERSRIEKQIEALNVGPEEQKFLVEQLKAPSDPIAIARLSTSEEVALEIYAASLLAVDIDTPQERRYLDRLADALLLNDELKVALEEETAKL